MSDRILLFGAGGQLGKRLTVALQRAGYDVTAVGRERCDFATAPEKQLEMLAEAVDPFLIINAAAYTAVDMAESQPELAQRINGTVPGMLAHIAQSRALKLLHFSTDYVFDGLRGAPYTPHASTAPLNAYGASKCAGEEAVRQFGGHIFRLQWVYDSAGKNFFLTMLKLMAEKPELAIVADQIGAPSYAAHLAEAIARAVPLIRAGTLAPDIYHLPAQGVTSWHGFAVAIMQAAGRHLPIRPLISEEYPVPATRPKDARLDSSVLAAHGITMPHWRESLSAAMEELYAAG